MRTAYIKIIIYTFCAGLFSSCNKNEEQPPVDLNGRKVFMVCEGSYQNGNASLSIYFPEKDSLYNNVYESVNGRALGDVFQSMQKVGSYYFLCINNSDRIIVVKEDLTLHTTIAVPKPRYLLPVSDGKAYVSSLYTNKVFVLDTKNMNITGSIDLPARNTEGMLFYDNKAYICTWDTASDKVYVIDILQDRLTDSLMIAGRAPSEIVADKDEKLWVISGNATQGQRCYLTRVDPVSHRILTSYAFPEEADAIRPVMNPAKDSIYFITANFISANGANGLFRMSVYDPSLPSVPFISSLPYQYFWALDIHPFTGEIYLGDPMGFSQKSRVRIYDVEGTLKTQFETGVGIGHFYFD